MKLFIGNLPSFYRIQQWNRIAERISLYVILTEELNLSDRNGDFYHGERKFDCSYLSGKKYKKILDFIKLLYNHRDCTEIIVDGWDSIYSWIAAFFPCKTIKSCIVESTIYESPITGIRGIVKRLFLSKMSKAYPCGKAHVELIKRLGFNGRIVETGGCGILNYKPQPIYEPRDKVTNFLFVGRLVDVKNLPMLVKVFNCLPELCLTIVGFGEEEQMLKDMANDNVIFVGPVNNQQLWNYYRKADVFVLPSKSETWGLVVEEALNNGTPVIVSNMVGCNNELANEKYGLVFDCYSSEHLKETILKMTDINYYNKLRKNIATLDFNIRAQHQIDIFCNND